MQRGGLEPTGSAQARPDDRLRRNPPLPHSSFHRGARENISGRLGAPFFCRAMGVLQITRWWNSAADLPDVSKCFRGVAQSIHASDHHATLHGVVFDILVGSERRVGLAAIFPADRSPPGPRLRGPGGLQSAYGLDPATPPSRSASRLRTCRRTRRVRRRRDPRPPSSSIRARSSAGY
jgi:hypothetical protein